MKNVEYVVLMKENLSDFISRLAKFQKLIAPVPRGYNNFSFKEVSSADEISLKYIPTVLPPKKFFMPQHESLIEFSTVKGFDVTSMVEHEKMTIFGVHTCDLAGIQCLNMVFSIRPHDHNYLTRKRMIDIIGLECNEYCDEYASCCVVSSHLPSGGYDIFFTDIGDYFIAHVNTLAGERIIETTKVFRQAENFHLDALKEVRERKRTIFKNEVPVEGRFLPAMFDRSFECKAWEELEERCLACGNCTNVCPTCYCFDIIDEVNLDLKSGRRYRKWDSCQLEPFAKVAGGENFRKKRSARQRHRYYRKFRYPTSKFARFFCTGCGRCTRTCMARISLKETLNSLIKEMEMAIWKKWL